MPFALGGVVRGSAMLCSLALAACGGGGGGNEVGPSPNSPHPGSSRTVTLTWDANRESAVNRTGGGYEVFINVDGTCCSFDVPYSGGPAAPTSITVQLFPGRYLASVRAYGALDRQGSSNRNLSSASPTPFPLDVQ